MIKNLKVIQEQHQCSRAESNEGLHKRINDLEKEQKRLKHQLWAQETKLNYYKEGLERILTDLDTIFQEEMKSFFDPVFDNNGAKF